MIGKRKLGLSVSAVILLGAGLLHAAAIAEREALPITDTTLHYISHAADNWLYFGRYDGKEGRLKGFFKRFGARGGGELAFKGTYHVTRSTGGVWLVAFDDGRSMKFNVTSVNPLPAKAKIGDVVFEAEGNVFDPEGNQLWAYKDTFKFIKGNSLGKETARAPALAQ